MREPDFTQLPDDVLRTHVAPRLSKDAKALASLAATSKQGNRVTERERHDAKNRKLVRRLLANMKALYDADVDWFLQETDDAAHESDDVNQTADLVRDHVRGLGRQSIRRARKALVAMYLQERTRMILRGPRPSPRQVWAVATHVDGMATTEMLRGVLSNTYRLSERGRSKRSTLAVSMLEKAEALASGRPGRARPA